MLRYSEVAILILVVALIIWLDMPKLLAPVVLLTISAFSAWRWYRGLWPWPPGRRES
jgi:hypothetical protein